MRLVRESGLTMKQLAVRVIYMGEDKPSVIQGPCYLIERGIDVAAVVAPDRRLPSLCGQKLGDAAAQFGIPVTVDEDFCIFSVNRTMPSGLIRSKALIW